MVSYPALLMCTIARNSHYGSILEAQSKRTAMNHNRMLLSDVDEWKILTPKLSETPSNQAHYHTLYEASRVANEYEAIFFNDFCPHDRKPKMRLFTEHIHSL